MTSHDQLASVAADLRSRSTPPEARSRAACAAPHAWRRSKIPARPRTRHRAAPIRRASIGSHPPRSMHGGHNGHEPHTRCRPPGPSRAAGRFPRARSRTRGPGGSRRPEQRQLPAPLERRCAAARPPGRSCRRAGRGRRASGTSRCTCSRRDGTRPAVRRSDSTSRAEVAGAFFDGWPELGNARSAAPRPAAADIPPDPETAREIRLRHQQLALKDAVAERRHQAEPHGPPAAIDHDVVAETLVQDVGHRVRVGDDGHDAPCRRRSAG